MSDYQHTTISLGFTVTEEDRPNRLVRIRGKRRWYAPWLRYPDRWYDPADAFAAAHKREMASVRNKLMERLNG